MAADNKNMMRGDPWLFTMLSETVGEGVTLSDTTGRFALYNSKMRKITGYTAAETGTLNEYLELLFQDYAGSERAKSEIQEIFHRECRNRETVIRSKDGTSKTVLISTTPLEYQGVQFLLHVYRDVTFRKTTEEKLLIAEKRYRVLCEQSFDALVIIDPVTFLPTDFNDKALGLFGYTNEEFARIKFDTLEVHGIFRQKKSLNKPKPAEEEDDFETEVHTKNAGLKNVKVSKRVFEISGKRLFQYIFHEIAYSKHAVIKRDKGIVEVHNTPDKNTMLKGTIPICYVCRKIYDEKGFWRPMESSTSERSDVLFSHELCPVCEERFYPKHLSKYAQEEEKARIDKDNQQ